MRLQQRLDKDDIDSILCIYTHIHTHISTAIKSVDTVQNNDKHKQQNTSNKKRKCNTVIKLFNTKSFQAFLFYSRERQKGGENGAERKMG